jgi:multimeric flavodoxin WrbA
MGKYDDLIPRGGQTGKPQSKVLGVGGSPRRGGNSDVLLKQVLKGVAERDITATGIHLRDFQYQGCVGCEQCRRDKICTGLRDGISLVYPAIADSQGLILVSPTHNYNVTAWMKAFIDRLYCFYDFDNHRPRGWSSRLAGQGRKAVVVAVCEQESEADMGFTLEAMRLPLEALGYEVVAELPAIGFFDRGKVKEDEALLARARQCGADLADALI